MNIKIHGGGSGTYANAGSSAALVNYLQHEDLGRLQQGEALEPFFNQAQALKEYIRQALMPAYAANFNKGLGAEDILYFAKVQYERNRETGQADLHAHILVSRKDISNKLKLSPATNHRGTQKGAVRGGFDQEACSYD
jgi:hypothetical protein